jgi:hypothetical protein
MIAQRPSLVCYPPAPLNGGPLETAPEKVGEWVWQPKVDDWRAVIHVPSASVWNQYGQPSSIADKFEVAIATLQISLSREPWAFEWLDVGMMENRNDLMRGCIIVMDMIVSELLFANRRAILKRLFPALPFDVSRLLAETGGQVRDSVYLISQWDNVENREDALKRQTWLQNENKIIGHKFYEGLVAKRTDSLYPIQMGRPKTKCPAWIKHRMDMP